MRYPVLLFVMAVGAAALAACGDSSAPEPRATPAPDALREHSKLFEKEVVEVTDGVHVAVGFGLANSIMLEGDDGIIIVDISTCHGSTAAI